MLVPIVQVRLVDDLRQRGSSYVCQLCGGIIGAVCYHINVDARRAR